MTLPYENATSGKRAVDEMQKILKAFGAGSFGIMEDWAAGDLIVQFEHGGRQVTLHASIRGYAAAWLREHPWSNTSRIGRQAHERRAMAIAGVAVYSILRDWIKAQVTAIAVGMLTFEGAFLGQIMLPNGQTVLERISAAGGPLQLPAPR